MKLNVYSIFDSKAKAYLPPFYLHTHGLAERAFGDCINSRDHQFSKNPADYTLFHLGTFEDDCALFDTFAPVSLGNGLEFVVSKVDASTGDLFADDTQQVRTLKKEAK